MGAIYGGSANKKANYSLPHNLLKSKEGCKVHEVAVTFAHHYRRHLEGAKQVTIT
jgi:hypothetical protein